MDNLTFSEFIAGWISGCFGIVVGHPFDTIKVRQQALGGLRGSTIIKETYRLEGASGFYKGLFFPLLSAGALNAVFFGVYGNSLRQLEKFHGSCSSFCKVDPESIPRSDHFIAGSVAGLVAAFFGCPVDLIKVKLQTDTATSQTWSKYTQHGYKGPRHAIADIFKNEGFRGFWRGFTIMAWRDTFSSGIYIMTYSEFHGRNKDPVKIMLAGGFAGVLSWMLSLPADVIKSRLQADNLHAPQYKGVIDCVVKSFDKHGMKVFVRGIWFISMRGFLVNSAIFLGYEKALKVCEYVGNSVFKFP